MMIWWKGGRGSNNKLHSVRKGFWLGLCYTGCDIRRSQPPTLTLYLPDDPSWMEGSAAAAGKIPHRGCWRRRKQSGGRIDFGDFWIWHSTSPFRKRNFIGCWGKLYGELIGIWEEWTAPVAKTQSIGVGGGDEKIEERGGGVEIKVSSVRHRLECLLLSKIGEWKAGSAGKASKIDRCWY